MQKKMIGKNSKSGANAVTQQKKILAVLVVFASFVATVLPAIVQDQTYHQFADQRRFFGVPNTFDSLSNLAFIGFALWGLVLQWRKRLLFQTMALQRLATLFFLGFMATGFGSFGYHIAPHDASLVLDRLGMVIAFAGVLGMVAAHKVSPRAGNILAVVVLLLGPFSVYWWQYSANLAPYAVMQFGDMALMMWMIFLRSSVCSPVSSTMPSILPVSAHGPNWALFIALYVFAKIFETFDHQIFQWTHQWLSGHTLKHLAAACTALAVILPARQSHQSTVILRG